MIDEPYSNGHPCIWCDMCGWGDTVGVDQIENPYHFCRRHDADQVKAFMDGRELGYFEGQTDLFE